MIYKSKWVEFEVELDLSDFTDEELEEELIDRGKLYSESSRLDRYCAQFLLKLIEDNENVKPIGFRLSDLIEELKDISYE